MIDVDGYRQLPPVISVDACPFDDLVVPGCVPPEAVADFSVDNRLGRLEQGSIVRTIEASGLAADTFPASNRSAGAIS